MSTLPVQAGDSCCPAVLYPSIALQPAVVVRPSVPIPAVVPASCTNVIEIREEQPTTYPSEEVGVEYTYASYGEELSHDVFKRSPNNPSNWTLSLSVPIPSRITNPTLTSLTYIIKYATTHDVGNSTVQADVVLTTTPCAVGIIPNSTHLEVYRNGPGYGPRMVDNSKAKCLSSALAIKCNGGTAQWSHYIDHRHLIPTVRVVGSANLYLNFHVFEYPTAETLRCLAIEVSAGWFDAEAEKTAEEAKKKAPETTIHTAPPVADEGMQLLIETKLEELGIPKCPNGFGWKKTSTGYECGGGGHKLTFEQLGMKS